MDPVTDERYSSAGLDREEDEPARAGPARRRAVFVDLLSHPNAWIWDRELPAQSFLVADLERAAEGLNNGVILGYAAREVGGVSGVLTISQEDCSGWKKAAPAGWVRRGFEAERLPSKLTGEL